MAVFERKSTSELEIDDTVPLTCVIEAANKRDSHVDYEMKVQRGPNSSNCWKVSHRYSDFDSLNSVLEVSGVDLFLPPKKVFGNMDSTFIMERQRGLQQYINNILSNPYISQHIAVKKFLDPRIYSTLEENAKEQVAMFFRSEPAWEVVEPMKDIGWRVRKNFFLIKYSDAPKKDLRQVLSWVELGQDSKANVKDVDSILKLLPSIQHPYIYPITYAHCTENETGACIIRNFNPPGTLRDFICKAKPKMSQLKKYANPKSRVAMQLSDIRVCGRQVLEGLKFLQEKGIPYGHLHSGNVMMDGNVCRLLDIENGVLGVPSMLRHYLVELRKVGGKDVEDVYCFGHLLYEMTFSTLLNRPTIDDLPSTCPPQIKPILQSILSTSACKSKLPTVTDLLNESFFSDVRLPPIEKVQFKIPSKVKEVIQAIREASEKRLKEDQKLVHHFKRLSKAHQEFTSEEAKKKRKKSAKKKSQAGQPEQQSSSTSAASSTAAPAASKAADTPAPPPAPPAPAPPPPASPPPPRTTSPVPSGNGGDRSSLLSSISGFNKGGLKKAETVDKSKPVI